MDTVIMDYTDGESYMTRRRVNSEKRIVYTPTKETGLELGAKYGSLFNWPFPDLTENNKKLERDLLNIIHKDISYLDRLLHSHIPDWYKREIADDIPIREYMHDEILEKLVESYSSVKILPENTDENLELTEVDLNIPESEEEIQKAGESFIKWTSTHHARNPHFVKKYELTKETLTYFGKTLYRIKALKDFSNVKKGDLGGFLESEANLSQTGDAWVYGDAKVYGDAWVYGDAKVYGDARVFGDAKVYGDALITSAVYGNSTVKGQDIELINAEVDSQTSTPAKPQCTHNWVATQGFTNTYWDCSICGAKREEVEA